MGSPVWLKTHLPGKEGLEQVRRCWGEPVGVGFRQSQGPWAAGLKGRGVWGSESRGLERSQGEGGTSWELSTDSEANGELRFWQRSDLT